MNAALVSGLNTPVGVAVSGGNLYVANSGNGTIGEYDATLDSKGRFLLPAGLRKIMPEGTAALVVNRGLDARECNAAWLARASGILHTQNKYYHARTKTYLRELQRSASARFGERHDLQLRMHFLPFLRRKHSGQCVPELRRRFLSPTYPAEE